MASPKRTAVLVKFPDDLLERIEDAAAADGIDRMAAIVKACRSAYGAPPDVRSKTYVPRKDTWNPLFGAAPRKGKK